MLFGNSSTGDVQSCGLFFFFFLSFFSAVGVVDMSGQFEIPVQNVSGCGSFFETSWISQQIFFVFLATDVVHVDFIVFGTDVKGGL